MEENGEADPSGQVKPSQSASPVGVILSDMADNLSEIVQRSLGVEEVVIHWGKRWRTSLAGTVRPWAASPRPSSIAARVSLSSSSSRGSVFSTSKFFALAMAHDIPHDITVQSDPGASTLGHLRLIERQAIFKSAVASCNRKILRNRPMRFLISDIHPAATAVVEAPVHEFVTCCPDVACADSMFGSSGM